MTLIILLAIPGGIAFYFSQRYSRSRSKAGWDFLIITGIFGGIAFILSRILLEIFWALVEKTESVARLQNLKVLTLSYLPAIPHPTTYYFAVLISPLLGIIIGQLLYGYTTSPQPHWLANFISDQFEMPHRLGEKDVLNQLSSIKSPIVVSTSNGQVYIGALANLTADPDESLKILK